MLEHLTTVIKMETQKIYVILFKKNFHVFDIIEIDLKNIKKSEVDYKKVLQSSFSEYGKINEKTRNFQLINKKDSVKLTNVQKLERKKRENFSMPIDVNSLYPTNI